MFAADARAVAGFWPLCIGILQAQEGTWTRAGRCTRAGQTNRRCGYWSCEDNNKRHEQVLQKIQELYPDVDVWVVLRPGQGILFPPQVL